MPSKTKAASSYRAETDGTERQTLPAAWHQLAGRVMESCDFTNHLTSTPYTGCNYVFSCISPRAVEANRQVERLKHAKDFAEAKGVDVDADGLVSSIMLLQNMATGPIPIPVASWDPEGGASLFISQGDF